MNIFIGLSKGELAGGIQDYLARFGVPVDMESRTYTQRLGDSIFRLMRSRDVPRLVGRGYDFGITGRDCCEDEKLGGNGAFEYLEDLDFGKGDLVFYGTGGKVPRNPRVVTTGYYSNLAEKFSKELFGEPSVVSSFYGAIEGFVSNGEYDVGFDYSTSGKTAELNKLVMLEKVMPTCAVVIGRKGLVMDDFENVVLDGGFEFGKMGGLIPAVVQDRTSGEILMLAYMNPESLRKTRETGLATFWSRSRDELWTKGATSGNMLRVVDIAKDCDGDAMLLKVDAKGPACHTGRTSCFYRKK